MEKQKLIYVESKAQFSPSEVSDKAIVFIKDTKEIWTHGVYFSCSGTWATSITLSLTGDTTGSVSIDGSGNASIATTTNYLATIATPADANDAASTLWHKISYYRVNSSASNLFPVTNNANGILSLNVHDYSYTHQLGFSSDGNIYHRRRSGGTWETSWKTILNSSNYTNYHHTFESLTNKPTTLSGYGITDCIPIIKGGLVTTDTDLSTLGMTTIGAKLSVSRTTDGTGVPSWWTPYSNFLMFRSTGDTYSGIATYTFEEYVTFVGGRNLETAATNVPNWWFRIKGNSSATYDLNSFQNTINNLDSNYLRKSGGTMTGALNFANNTWNKVGDDAYMGDCNVAGMIGIKGINADTPGFAMYNTAGTLLGKLYASGTNLYWSDKLLATANGSSTQFMLGDGTKQDRKVTHQMVSYDSWTKTTTTGTAWFPIATVPDVVCGSALFIVKAYAHSSIIFTVTRGRNKGNINILGGGGNFNPSYAYIRGVRLIGATVELGLNAAATLVQIVVKGFSPCYDYLFYGSLAESTNTTTPIVQYDINTGGNNDFGIISSKFTGNLTGNADTASNISTVNPILAQPFEKNTIQVVSNPQGALAEQQGTAAAITHALRFNWYNTAYEIGNVRGGASNSLGFGITYGNNNLCLLVKTNGTYSPYGFIGDLTGNAASANKWAIARTITLTGDVTGSVSLDGSSNVTLTTTTSGTGTTSFLKCPDKRNSYPAQIVTAGETIGASFMTASKLGISGDGSYYDALIVRGYRDHTGGNENAIMFSKNTSSVYHSQYAFGSTTTWGTIHKFLDSNNYSSYALPLAGGTMTGAISSMNITPKTNNTYNLGSTSYYYKGAYSYGFYKNGSSDSYVLLGGGGHKAVSDFAPNNVATLSSSGMGNSDQWTLVFEQSYPASHWYEPIAMFYVKGGTVGCGILCFYNYWNSATKLNAYEKEVWFFGAGKSETSATFGGTNRDINDYLRIYIDTANFKYYIYYNRYNDRDVKIQELQFFESPDPLHSSFFTNSTTVVNLPTESSTLVRVPIKTTYNHDRTIKTSKSIYASSFYENSDIRLKENIQRIDQSDLTKQVDLVQFNFKDSDTKKYGVIAQQLEQVGLQNLVYENDGKKAVDYISLLVLEIQRLRNEIGELKQEIHKKS